MDRRPSYGLGFSGLRRFWLQGPDLESRRRKLDPSCDFRMTRLPLTQAIFPIQGAEASSMGWVDTLVPGFTGVLLRRPRAFRMTHFRSGSGIFPYLRGSRPSAFRQDSFPGFVGFPRVT